MDGIDISNWQAGINVARIPGDFVIVKATEGTGFTSSTFQSQISAAHNAGKLVGAYHYIKGKGAAGEMRHIYNVIKDWVGKALICIDWESGGNSAWGDISYLRRCIEEIKALTGKVIIVYASKSVFPWDAVKATGSRAWVAQYADNSITGYQSHPWNEGAFDCLIRQYSSHGRLDGYNGNLDLNKAYCTREEWMKLAGAKTTQERKLEVRPIQNNGGKVYRYYNTKTGEHFLALKGEGDTLKAPWKCEGVAFTAPKGGIVPIYRLRAGNGLHMFTANYNEAVALEKAGWTFELVPFFGNENGTPVYRLYDAKSGDHLFTTNANERKTLKGLGWKDEGIAFHV